MFTTQGTAMIRAIAGLAVAAAALTAAATGPLAAQATSAGDAVARIGDYVERYYQRVQSLVADEVVSIQPLTRDLAPDGFARRLMYELRLEWNPDVIGDEPPANVTRHLISVNGRPPRPGDEPECLDPKSVSPEPLAFLLPDQREKYTWIHAGLGRIDGRAALIVDYKSVKAEAPKATWVEQKRTGNECGSIELPGRSKGRVWVDPETSEVLRLVEGITGMVDVRSSIKQQKRGGEMYLTIERAETTTDYKRVSFSDPDETLLLPSRVETLTIIRNSGSPRTRITQTFTNYRRFITGSRIVQ